MHYRNGREAKNGDKVVLLAAIGFGNQEVAVGILYDAVAGNDRCNGRIAQINRNDAFPDLKDVLHLDDVLAAVAAK